MVITHPPRRARLRGVAGRRPARAPTVGVEEEFLLLDPGSGAAVPAAAVVMQQVHGEPGVHAELMRFQVETTTPVCAGLEQLDDHLHRLRRLSADAAQAAGCLLVASGVAPYGTPGLAALSDDPRYREMARRYPCLTADSGTCGCHVHVAVPSRQHGVRILAQLRPWLATLLALSVNSPIAEGRDTGWASHRYRLWSRWPTATPPPAWRDTDEYDAHVERLIRQGAAVDERSIYFLARLSPRYPTIEVRVPDVAPDVDTAVLLAGLIRGLVATALRGRPHHRHSLMPVATPDLRAALTAAARHGLDGLGTDPLTGQAAAQTDILVRLVEYAQPALDAIGDTPYLNGLLSRTIRGGTGADRQRTAWTTDTAPSRFVADLAARTRSPGAPRSLGEPATGGTSYPARPARSGLR